MTISTEIKKTNIAQARAILFTILLAILLAAPLNGCGGSGGDGGGEFSADISADDGGDSGGDSGGDVNEDISGNDSGNVSDEVSGDDGGEISGDDGGDDSGDDGGEDSGDDGGDSGDTIVYNLPTEAPANVTISVAGIKNLEMEWDFVPMADHFIINLDADGTSNYVEVEGATNIEALWHSWDISVHRIKWGTAQYTVDACDPEDSTRVRSDPVTLPVSFCADAIGYFKASNTNSQDYFGHAVALSGDGKTMAVGACYESSSATGVNGTESDNSFDDSGAVYIFTRSSSGWVQEAYIKASNTQEYDEFGWSVALSQDGNTLAVGAYKEDSAATGINGDETNNDAEDAGAVYVFTRTDSDWTQEAYIKASNPDESAQFGYAVSLSSDGDTLLVGSYEENSAATGIDGDQFTQVPYVDTDSPEPSIKSGAAYVFTRSDSTWSQETYIKASNTGYRDNFGRSVALSGDANTIAISAPRDDSIATGIDCDQFNDSPWSSNEANNIGAVYIFARTDTTWAQQAYIKGSNTDKYDYFGWSLGLSHDGNTLAASAYRESSNATGIDGDQSNNSASSSGAAYIFTRTDTTWAQETYIKASNTNAQDWFGWSLALSKDGNTLAVGARQEDGSATGINGNDSDNSTPLSGCAYTFTQTASGWSQQAYVKASNTGVNDYFGTSIAISDDGATLAVGAEREFSSATGIGGNQANQDAYFAGAVYLY